MSRSANDTRNDTNSLWTSIGPIGAAILGIVGILLALIATFWVPFVAVLVPVVIIVAVAGAVMTPRATPSDRDEQDLANVGYQGPEAEYGVESESTTGDSVG